jgi:hypothetical protein
MGLTEPYIVSSFCMESVEIQSFLLRAANYVWQVFELCTTY